MPVCLVKLTAVSFCSASIWGLLTISTLTDFPPPPPPPPPPAAGPPGAAATAGTGTPGRHHRHDPGGADQRRRPATPTSLRDSHAILLQPQPRPAGDCGARPCRGVDVSVCPLWPGGPGRSLARTAHLSVNMLIGE